MRTWSKNFKLQVTTKILTKLKYLNQGFRINFHNSLLGRNKKKNNPPPFLNIAHLLVNYMFNFRPLTSYCLITKTTSKRAPNFKTVTLINQLQHVNVTNKKWTLYEFLFLIAHNWQPVNSSHAIFRWLLVDSIPHQFRVITVDVHWMSKPS